MERTEKYLTEANGELKHRWLGLVLRREEDYVLVSRLGAKLGILESLGTHAREGEKEEHYQKILRELARERYGLELPEIDFITKLNVKDFLFEECRRNLSVNQHDVLLYQGRVSDKSLLPSLVGEGQYSFLIDRYTLADISDRIVKGNMDPLWGYLYRIILQQ